VTLLSSDPAPLRVNAGWTRNGAGLLYNPRYCIWYYVPHLEVSFFLLPLGLFQCSMVLY
jgi:hypothetical protein